MTIRLLMLHFSQSELGELLTGQDILETDSDENYEKAAIDVKKAFHDWDELVKKYGV